MAMADAADLAEDYVSPLAERIESVRNTVLANARDNKWQVDRAGLDDRHIVKRMVLKRCIYGVDKNPMAVELAKVSLWLHTFTVGAPLSFLDHHLRCGDSLFGASVRTGMDRAKAHGAGPLLNGPAQSPALGRQQHAGGGGARRRRNRRGGAIRAGLGRCGSQDRAAGPLPVADSCVRLAEYPGQGRQGGAPCLFRRPVRRPAGDCPGPSGSRERTARRPGASLRCSRRARRLVEEERFLNWQVSFPGVWQGLENARPIGGFRRRDRQPALGADEAATGGVVRPAPTRNCACSARRRPQADDRRTERRPETRWQAEYERGPRARGGCRQYGAQGRRLPAAIQAAT